MFDSKVRLSGGGYTITLTNTAEELHRAPNGSGWGMAPVANFWFEGAGDGDHHRGTRRMRRELTIPIQAFGNTPRQVEANIRNLVRIVRNPFKVYIDINSGPTFWIDAVYVSGIEGAYTVAPEQWADLPVVLHCPDPYWTSSQSQSFTVAPIEAATPFLEDFSAMHVASSAAFGEVLVSNIGDVESPPTWTIHGPGTNPTILVNGDGFILNKVLTSSDIVTVTYVNGGWTIVDQTDANLYGDLDTDPPPIFPLLPPGNSNVTASMTGTGVESYINCIYPERREVVY